MAAKRTPGREQKQPLAALDEIVPKLTHDELIEATIHLFEEGAYRADNYLDVIEDAVQAEAGELPRDMLNEARAFVAKMCLLTPSFSRIRRVEQVSWRLHDAEKDMLNIERAAAVA